MTAIRTLENILMEISKTKEEKFSGVGLVVYKKLDHLPISSLKNVDESIILPITNYEAIKTFLISTSNSNNKYHDGFHLLNSEFQLTHICQYISPPIVKNLSIDSEFGSRYRTAIYTSILENVIACGVLSLNYSPTIFVKGNKSNLAKYIAQNLRKRKTI